MVDYASIASFASSLKAASDIAKSLLGLKITGEVQAKVIELQTVIMSAQSDALSAQQAQFELLAKVRALEEEIAGLKTMGAERERYELKQVDRGAFAYVLKPEAETGEEPHWLCVPCFNSGYKSVLQNQGGKKDRAGFVAYGCSRCGEKMETHWRAKPHAVESGPESPGSGMSSVTIERR